MSTDLDAIIEDEPDQQVESHLQLRANQKSKPVHQLNIVELRKYAVSQGMSGVHKLNKAQLLSLLGVTVPSVVASAKPVQMPKKPIINVKKLKSLLVGFIKNSTDEAKLLALYKVIQ